jgi:hypothetical protein
MKDAVKRDLVGDCWYETEYTIKRYGAAGLRVDVSFTKNKREYLVECETQPNIKRLVNKGRRRNKISYRTTYFLVVPSEFYKRTDWGQLRGYFDIIFAYDVDRDILTEGQDLRFLGSLYVQCTACKLNIPTPWIFCHRDDCPDSVYGCY